eukprot:scaffold145_cov173-Amphora_coffeaeformis.AAC.15
MEGAGWYRVVEGLVWSGLVPTAAKVAAAREEEQGKRSSDAVVITQDSHQKRGIKQGTSPCHVDF